MPDHIGGKINAIHIPITDIEDKLAWKFTYRGEYSVKTKTWAKNYSIRPPPKTIVNIIWK